jgi:hypothetical protein
MQINKYSRLNEGLWHADRRRDRLLEGGDGGGYILGPGMGRSWESAMVYTWHERQYTRSMDAGVVWTPNRLGLRVGDLGLLILAIRDVTGARPLGCGQNASQARRMHGLQGKSGKGRLK